MPAVGGAASCTGGVLPHGAACTAACADGAEGERVDGHRLDVADDITAESVVLGPLGAWRGARNAGEKAGEFPVAQHPEQDRSDRHPCPVG